MDFTASNIPPPPAALEALLGSLIDYAGLFPPAQLPLENALSDYVAHLADPELARYLGCFVIPVELLPQTSAWFHQRSDGIPARSLFSVLAGPENECGMVAATVREFEASLPGSRVEMLELRTKSSAADGHAGIPRLLEAMETALGDDGSRRDLFIEIDWRSDPSAAMALLAKKEGVGAKLRSGGLTPDLVPPPTAVARFLTAAARFGLPVKFTAGLHVPVPNDDPKVGARMHGFLNVLAAAMAAYRGGTSVGQLVQILEQFDYPDFSFDEKGFRAGGQCFGADEIQRLRGYIRSFGSCSFLEPLDHLATHGLRTSSARKQESLAQ